MKCELVSEVRVAAGDARYRVDVLQGISNLNGDGHELDIFAAMDRAAYQMPTYPPDTIWRADVDAFKMMERQATRYGKSVLIPMEEVECPKAGQISFRGKPIEIVDG